MTADAYTVLNSDGLVVREFPYTVDGFYSACEQVDRKPNWRIVNLNRIDYDSRTGLSHKEKETAEEMWGLVL